MAAHSAVEKMVPGYFILKRAVGHTPETKMLDEVYLHPKATQMIEAFDKANQLVNDEVLTTTKA